MPIPNSDTSAVWHALCCRKNRDDARVIAFVLPVFLYDNASCGMRRLVFRSSE